ncbi:MAG: hypothetical protein ABR571_11720 [Jatrophihabitans sp.]|uniref:hypothetical protein n=1 Tax=Jatrophihabitans sp. TaxID=1932789 RepID=UPI003916BD26
MSDQGKGSGGATGAAARVFGKGLAGVFGAAGRLRPATKPLHPRGSVHAATLERVGLSEPTGVDWLDTGGVDEVLVRLSRSVGLPGPVPDVLGLAIRVPLGGSRHGDLLFATTGSGPIGRFVLRPVRDPAARYSTLLPYRTPAGSLLLAAAGITGPAGDLRFDLQVASPPRGPWRRFGSLTVFPEPSPDEYVAFDPMTNPIAGLEPYDWIRQLRARSYRAARHSRGDERVQP